MRRRMIDPGFWKDAKIGKLSPPARLAFIYAWNAADDEGRMDDWNAATMRGGCMAYDDITLIQASLVIDEIAAQGLILPYTINNHLYHTIPNFKRYQTINRPTESKLPPPPFDVSGHDTITEDSLNTHGGLSEDSCNVSPKLSKDKLSKVKPSKDIGTAPAPEGAQPNKRQKPVYDKRVRLNVETWELEGLTDEDRGQFRQTAPGLDVDTTLAAFIEYAQMHPKWLQDRLATGAWKAALNTWFRNQARYASAGMVKQDPNRARIEATYKRPEQGEPKEPVVYDSRRFGPLIEE